MPEGDQKPKWTKLKPGKRFPIAIGPPMTMREYDDWLNGRFDPFPAQSKDETQSSCRQDVSKPYRGKAIRR
jgi:hypothetical protein